jgi:lactam utilization protein B
MKKIVVAVAAVAAFSFSAIAQEAKSPTAAQNHEQQKEKKDEIYLKDGKLVSRVDGKETAVEKDVTLKNGTVVMANGTVKTTDGKTVTLKEGDVINPEGKIWNKKEMHEQNKVMKSEVNK